MTSGNVSETGLEGRRILVAEDEFFLAMDLEDMLRDVGAVVVGPVATVAQALLVLDEGHRIDLAVLDMNLGGDMVFPVADRLRAADIPLIFATGYGQGDLPARFTGVPRFEKPVDLSRIVQALRRVSQPDRSTLDRQLGSRVK